MWLQHAHVDGVWTPRAARKDTIGRPLCKHFQMQERTLDAAHAYFRWLRYDACGLRAGCDMQYFLTTWYLPSGDAVK